MISNYFSSVSGKMNTWVCQDINQKSNECTTHEAKVINDNLMKFCISFFFRGKVRRIHKLIKRDQKYSLIRSRVIEPKSIFRLRLVIVLFSAITESILKGGF